MSFNQEFSSYMPSDTMAPENFNGATSTNTPGDDATAALGDAQTGWLVNGTWYPLQDRPTRAGNAPQQEYHFDFTGHGSWPLASSQAQSYNQIPGDYLVSCPDLVNHGSTGVSPSWGNDHLPLDTVQQSAPNTYETPYFPAQGRNIGPASYGDWDVTPSYPQSGDYLVQYPHWVDPRSTGVSPSWGNDHLPLDTVQQSAPNTYETPYFPAQGRNIGPASYGDWDVTPSYPQSGDYLVQYPHWVDPRSTGVSPSWGNDHLPLDTIQWSAPNTYEPPYLPAPAEGSYYNANTTLSSVRLHPGLPLGEGIFSGMSNVVVGTAADTSLSAPSTHSHRKAGKKGGKKGEVTRVHDCAYDGKEKPLERGCLGYAKPRAIYQQLSELKTEALDYIILRGGEAHGVDSDGNYICRAQASIVGGIWRRDESVCGKRLQDKDCYRRHLEEQHFGLRRVVDGKYVKIETRIRRALEQIKEQERSKAEKEGRPTKKRKRASDEEECVGSSLPEREGETKKRRRAGTA